MVYEIGKMYLVPCVRADEKTPPRPARGSEWIPILLPFHEDSEIVNFPHWHYHLDFRFLSPRQWKNSGLSVVIHRRPVGDDALLEFFDGTVTYKRRKCLREMPSFYPETKWHKELSAAYAKIGLVKWKCPHRGLDLEGCPIVNGVVTCPGHGLRFNAKTGRVIQ